MAKKKSVVNRMEVPEGETKQARFKRIVIPRVIKAEKAIRLIGNCAGSSYGYEPIQIEQIKGTLLVAVTDVISKFTSSKQGSPKFEFKE